MKDTSPHNAGGVYIKMDWVQLLTAAYGATGFISLVGYVPQFKAFLSNKRACQDAPVATWALWGFQSAIVVSYAGLINGDTMFLIGGCLGAVGNVGGLLLVLWGRRGRKGQKTEAIIIQFPTPPPSPKPAKGMAMSRGGQGKMAGRKHRLVA